MASRKRLTDSTGKVRELTATDDAVAVPFAALPAGEQAMLRSIRRRGAQKAPCKKPISIRLSPKDCARPARDGSAAPMRFYDHGLLPPQGSILTPPIA